MGDDTDGSINILVDSEPATFTGAAPRGVLPTEKLEEVEAEIVNLSLDAVSQSLGGFLGKLDRIFSDAGRDLENFQLDEVSVGLHMDAKGSISLLGMAKAEAAASTTFQVTLRPK